MRLVSLCHLMGFAIVLSGSAPPSQFTTRDRAYFADPAIVNFVRPGLVIRITSASVAADGTIAAQFTVTDPQGLPLDLAGVTTPGTVTASFVASYIPRGGADYIPITSRPATGAVSGAIRQPGADTGGTTRQTADGQYTYIFATRAPSGFDPGASVTIGVYSSRNLSDFDLGTNSANAEYSFVPNGATAPAVHDVIHTATCNKCHDPLMAHGGARRDVALCVLCHNPGGNGVATVDPDTGNTLDFKVMVHKIHMGSSLPSVQAGTPYRFVGFNNAVTDFSGVVFPAQAQNCQMCHENGAPPQGGTAPPGSMTVNNPAPAQGDWWLTHPSRAACGSCHDNVNFATGQNHANLPQVSDNLCTTCHTAQGELSFDLSIIGAHTITTMAPELGGVVFAISRVTNGGPGQSPTVTFGIKDRAGNPIAPSQMTSLSLTLAGPAAEYQTFVTESATTATGSNGTYQYTFKATVPANAAGTWSVGIEGYRNATLLSGTTLQMTVRDAGDNVVLDFAATGTTVTPHAIETTTANCNQCHYKLSAHGGLRNQTQYCILCHNPNTTDQARRPAGAGPATSVDFPVLIHRIHQGADSEAGGQLTPFIVYGFGGAANNFSDVEFPGDLRDCAKCHVNNSQQLPLPAARINVTNPQAWFSPMGPSTAACTACHTGKSTAAHTQLNTSPQFGEACDVCHGPNADLSVDKEHARTL